MADVEKLKKKCRTAEKAIEKVRELNRMKVHESFAVTKLTAELLDEYVESVEVRSEDEVRIIWK